MKKKRTVEYWQSYSDMTFALLLIFLLLVVAALHNLNKQSQELKEAQGRYEQALDEAEKAKRDAEDREKKAQEAGDAYMALEQELLVTKDKIEKIVGVKAEILRSLEETFRNEGIQIGIDDKTGAIIFQEDIFFDTAKYNLLQGGKDFLDQVMPIYLGVLLGEEYIDDIAEITIEGGCDSRGTTERNMALANNRAATVASYSTNLMRNQLSDEQYEKFESILVVSGRADWNLIYDEDGNEDMDASRRVEVKFRLKDEETIKEIQEWFKEAQSGE